MSIIIPELPRTRQHPITDMIPLRGGDLFSNPYHARAGSVAIFGRANPQQVRDTFRHHGRPELSPRHWPGLPDLNLGIPVVGSLLKRMARQTMSSILPRSVFGLERSAQAVLINFIFEANSIDPQHPTAHCYRESALLIGATTSTHRDVLYPDFLSTMNELQGNGRQIPGEKTGFFAHDVVIDDDPLAQRMGNAMGFDKQAGQISIGTTPSHGPHIEVHQGEGLAFDFQSSGPGRWTTRNIPPEFHFQMTTAAPVWCDSLMFRSAAFMTLPDQMSFRVGPGRMGQALTQIGFSPFGYMAGGIDSVSILSQEEITRLRAWMDRRTP